MGWGSCWAFDPDPRVELEGACSEAAFFSGAGLTKNELRTA